MSKPSSEFLSQSNVDLRNFIECMNNVLRASVDAGNQFKQAY